ncbi:zeta toxin family protein [Agreia sp. PsM10]|uniref:zeta toxin family protein n=1 Tax=Agreia sp. PsM10 TaxID=3030533 RepID=UPI00263AE90D|nr:zeta toxin family protein [Agreia sp. PsM10]MDN4641605.1 zeta toxin family protein [Agreia sp. PsM10]
MTTISRRYELQATELRSIFDEHIRPRYFADSAPRVRPTAVIVGGQSGSGLAAAATMFRRAYPPSRMPPVIGDEVRIYHPRYLELTATQPGLAVEATSQAAVEWARMAVDYAAAHGFSLILIGTLRKPGMVITGLRRLHDAGLHTQLSLLSVQPHVSRLATVQRFGRDHRRTGLGVWTPLSFHEAEYAGVEHALSGRTLESVCDRLSIYDGAGALLVHSDATAVRAGEALTAIHQGRSARLSQPAAEAWLRELHIELKYMQHLHVFSDEMPLMLNRLILDAHSVLLRAHPVVGAARSTAVAALSDAMRTLPTEAAEVVHADPAPTLLRPRRRAGPIQGLLGTA